MVKRSLRSVSPPRRSSRTRRKPVTTYDDAARTVVDEEAAAAAADAAASKTTRRESSVPPRRRRRQKDDAEEEEASVGSNREKEEVTVSDEESDGSNSSAEEEEEDSEAEEEEETVVKQRGRGRRSSKSPPEPAKARKIQVVQKSKKQQRLESSSNKKRKATDVIVTGKKKTTTTTRGSVQNALAALSKKVLDPEETPTTSLVAALLQAYKLDDAGNKNNNNNKGGGRRRRQHQNHRLTGGGKETIYTAQLQSIARRVLQQHDVDPNKAQIDLYNLLFRSVGGSFETNLDAETVVLDDLTNDDWANYITAVLEQMEERDMKEVLLCADPLGAAHEAAAESSSNSHQHHPSNPNAHTNTTTTTKTPVGVREYRKIYEEFWYVLGTTALTEVVAPSQQRRSSLSAGGRNNKKKRKTVSSDDDSSAAEGESDDDEPSSPAKSSSRFQVELARNILSRLVEIVAVGQPDIRAAATTAVYRLAVAMLEHTVELRNKLTVAERQLTVAKKHTNKKKSRGGSGGKADALKGQVDMWKRVIADLEEMVKGTVIGVFMRRYRDSNKHIRAGSLSVLSEFTLIRPDMFIAGCYLKYFGWLLSDKDECVREAAILGLLAPFRQASLCMNADDDDDDDSGGGGNDDSGPGRMDISGMKNVIDKFLPRLADCSIDASVRVQEKAMELLLVLSREGYMDTLENDELWQQINLRALAEDTSPTVRRDALLFVMEQLEVFDAGSATTEARILSQINSIAQWTAEILSDSDIPMENIKFELSDFVVSSLRATEEYKPLMCNWSAMLRALGGGGGGSASIVDKEAHRVEAVQQRVLLRMMVCAAELEVRDIASDGFLLSYIDGDLLAAQDTAAHVDGEKPPKKKKAKTTPHNSDSHEKLTAALLQALPGLLTSFRSETLVMQDLTYLPQYFLPSAFNLSRRKKDFTLLLSTLSDVFLESTDRTVLNNCMVALLSLAKSEHARNGEALNQLKEITRSLGDRLLDLYEEKAKLVKSENDSSLSDTQHAISLSLTRLNTLSKHWCIEDLLGDDAEQLYIAVSEKTAEDLIAREANKKSNDVDDDDEASRTSEKTQVNEIWETVDKRTHIFVADTVAEALSFLLSSTAWALQREIALRGHENEANAAAITSEELENHMVVRMRDRLVKLIALCYEQFIDPDQDATYPPECVAFASAVQEEACRVAGDLRSLFPRQWADPKAPRLLQQFALINDSHIIGGYVRYMRSIQFGTGDDPEDAATAERLLLPLARGATANWKVGNRREAGVALGYITGYGQTASSIVSSMSRVLKKIQPIRLLEAHMSCLRQDFEDWTDSEPEELASDRPSEEEMAEFEEAEKKHAQKFASIEHKSARLSTSLGVAQLKDETLVKSLLGFVMEGIRFAFSTDDPSCEEDLPLGARLPFLRILSKYLNWLRRDEECVKTIRLDLNKKEVELRNDPDFAEVYEEDLAALATFRGAGELGEFLPPDEPSTPDGGEENSLTFSESGTVGRSVSSSSFRRRMSHASSVSSIRSLRSKSTLNSLSPLYEEDAASMDADDDDNESKSDSPSTTKGRSVASNLSLSTLGEAIEEGSGESSGSRN